MSSSKSRRVEKHLGPQQPKAFWWPPIRESLSSHFEELGKKTTYLIYLMDSLRTALLWKRSNKKKAQENLVEESWSYVVFEPWFFGGERPSSPTPLVHLHVQKKYVVCFESAWPGGFGGFECLYKKWDFLGKVPQRDCKIRSGESNHQLGWNKPTLWIITKGNQKGKKTSTSWWFQPIWQILVKMGIFPK